MPEVQENNFILKEKLNKNSSIVAAHADMC